MRKNGVFCVLVIFLLTVFSSCIGVDEIVNTSKSIILSELFGTWGDLVVNISITSNKITYTTVINNSTFTANIISSTLVYNLDAYTKSEYPSGYKLDGNIISNTGTYKTEPIYAVGNDYSITIFLNESKNKIIEDKYSYYKLK